MRADTEFLELVERRRASALGLPGWQSDSSRLLTLLQVATRLRAMEIANRLETDLPWETVLATIIRWHHQVPIGIGNCSDNEAVDITIAAAEMARLDDRYDGVKQGAYKVRRRGTSILLRHAWDPAVEAADAYLERACSPTQLPPITADEREWLDHKPMDSRELPPIDILRSLTERASQSIDAYRGALPEGVLPDSFALDGELTVAHGKAVLAALMGLAAICEDATHSLRRTETSLLRLDRSRLLDLIEQLAPWVSASLIDTVVERLTYAPGRSGRVSPLVADGEHVIICSPLITPRGVDAILLRTAAYDPGRYGSVGRRQGDRARLWHRWFSDVPRTVAADRVRAYRPDGELAGDLDIVAVDRSAGHGVCVEAKSPIDPLTLSEATKTEDVVEKAIRLTAALREQLLAGALEVRLPRGWPDFSEIRWTWAVATLQQLCVRPSPVNDIYTTSFRYLVAHGRPRSLADVIGTITRPDLPEEGVHFTVEEVKMLAGGQGVVFQALGLAQGSWAPTPWS